MKIGKLICAIIGLLHYGLPGLIVGLVFGHMLDQYFIELFGLIPPYHTNNINHNDVFLTSTFSVMGKIAKADGRVSEQEINFAKNIMHSMQLNTSQQQQAIKSFNYGKNYQGPVDPLLQQLQYEFPYQRQALHSFLQIQFKMAHTTPITKNKQQLLQQICHILGFNSNFNHNYQQPQYYQHSDSLTNACRILGVKQDSSLKEIKLKYRKLMNQYHPDKLVAKKLSKQELEAATKKAQQIQQAYDSLKTIKSK